MAAVRAKKSGQLFTPTLVDQILDVLSLANDVIESVIKPTSIDNNRQELNRNWLQGALWLLKLLASHNSTPAAKPVENKVHAKTMKRRPPEGVNIWRDDFEFVGPGQKSKPKQAKQYSFAGSVYK